MCPVPFRSVPLCYTYVNCVHRREKQPGGCFESRLIKTTTVFVMEHGVYFVSHVDPIPFWELNCQALVWSPKSNPKKMLWLYTGWQSISEIMYGFTLTPFWVLVTFWAHGRLLRCGPFDKIGFWSHLMSFWDHLSLVSKETIFRRCTNFSDFCNFWKTISDHDSQKIGWHSDSWEWCSVSF